MTVRVCCEPGCPALTRRSRCVQHERARDRERGTRQERGYDAAHDQLRAEWQQRLNAGERILCWRCSRVIDARSWRLGHCDIDRRIYHGPEHVGCNQATSGRTGCPHPSHSAISPDA